MTSKIIKTFPPSGTRDFFPEDMLFRNWLFDVWKTISQQYGFKEYDLPIVEHSDLWTIKTGGTDILNEMFAFEKDGIKLTLRPEITPQLARMNLTYLPTQIFPVKLFSIPQCYRHETVSKGRKREFYQWNVDIFGRTPIKSEVDIFSVIVAFFKKIGLTSNDVVIRVSNRQILEKVLLNRKVTPENISSAFITIDKIEKLSKEDFGEELKKINMSDEDVEIIYKFIEVKTIDGLREFLPKNDSTLKQMETIFHYCQELGLAEWLQLDLSIVRGLAYYTGIVFEGFFKNKNGELKRAILGGGSYDDMMESYGYSDKVSGIGYGLGDVVIYEVLKELDRLPNLKLSIDYIIIPFNESFYIDACKIANMLRMKNKTVEVYDKPGKRTLAYSYADRKNAQYVIFVAPTEWKNNQIVVKDLRENNLANNKQITIDLDEYINNINNPQNVLIQNKLISNIYSIGEGPLKLKQYYDIAVNKQKVSLHDSAIERINKSRMVVDKKLNDKKVVYGINTGFGSLKDKLISEDNIEKLQYNLIVSCAIGRGKPVGHEIVRGMFLLRLVCIVNGNSGVRLEIAEKIVEALNKNYIPLVPEQGTVGASGDLTPLSHLILGLLGEGEAYDFETQSYVSAKIVMKKLNIEPIVLKAKEGLALSNGTQFITAITALATYNAKRIIKLANLIASCSIEALHGTLNAFDERIHLARKQPGQIKVAEDIRNYLAPNGIRSESNIVHTEGKIQDAYSLRCIPQVHGPAYDSIDFANKIIINEMNSSNDNPLVFDDDIISGGNFHAQSPSMAADQIAYAMSILCNISERRIERMEDNALNKFMPSFLVDEPGLNSGLMMIQYGAAGITAENRTLSAAASVHSIPTCGGTEDIVSMGGYSARKAMQSVENTYRVLTLELFTALQALEYTTEKPADKIAKIKDYVRNTLNIPRITEDTYMKPYVDKLEDYVKYDMEY